MTEKECITIIQDTSLSTTERGNALEKYLEEYVNCAYPEIGARRTKRSGALHGDGDVQASVVLTDCKVKGQCQNVNVTRAELDKINKQAAKNEENKCGAIVSPSVKDEKLRLYVTLSVDALLEILCDAY